MKDDTSLFKIGDDGDLEINKIEIRGIKEYNAILIRDKGSKGDFEGRKKSQAKKELMYVYTFYHPLSVYRDLPPKKKHSSCMSAAKLEKGWKVDEVIEKAGKALIRELDASSLFHSYLNANKAVYGIGEDLEYFNEERTRLRESIKEDRFKLTTETLEGEIADATLRLHTNTEKLLSLGDRIVSISNKLPEAFKTIEELKKKLAEESGKGKEVYGGGKINRREQA
jgi:hypothetical protein